MTWRWLLLSLVIAPVAAQNSPQNRDRDGAAVEGQVVNQRTGAPLAAVQIKLQGRNGEILQNASDRKGHFSFSGVEPGAYTLTAERSGFVLPAAKKMVLTLAAGETLKDLAVQLTPQAVVSGTLLDADGVPVGNVYVSVSRRTWQRGRKTLMFAGGAQTNDEGAFRISTLAAGDYFLCAHPRGLAVPPGDDDDKRRRIYVATWYPGVIDAASASVLHLAAGEERTGIAITLRASTVVKVSGRLVLPKSEMDIGMVMLMPADEPGAMDSFNPALVKTPDGAFTISDVPPGTYRIQAHIIELRAGQQNAFGDRADTSQTIQVGDRDVEGITLAPSVQNLSGVIQWDGKPPQDAGTCMVAAHHEQSGNMAITSKADGTFSIAKVPSEHFDLDVTCEAKGSYLKAARFGDTDVLEAGIDGAQPLPPGLLVVTMATGAGSIQGSVIDKDQHPVSGATVVAAPASSKRASLFHSATTDQNGRFKLSDVIPGSYLLYAWDELEGEAWFDEEFMKTYAEAGEHVHLEPSGSAAVQLHVIKVE